MRGYRVWAEIDLAAFRRNVETVRRKVGPQVKLLAVVKADAYGHGAVPVAWKALESGCHALGVGDSNEAIELRESGITGPILILGAFVEEEISRVVEYGIGVTLHSTDLLEILETEAARQHRTLKVHLKVDTGMGRLGVDPSRASDIAKEILRRPHLELEGLCTHLSSVNNGNGHYTAEQMTQFTGVLETLQREGIRPPVIHAANSVATMTIPDTHFHMVRIGIALYGMDPGKFAQNDIHLAPVLSLKTRIAFVKSVPAGTSIGYDQRYATPRATRIATCPVGYNDGYPHRLTNLGEALVRGQRVPVVGTVTMDYIMLDIGDVPQATVGDEVILIGRDQNEEIRVEDLARKVGTIAYEITCNLGRRVKRVYM